MEKKNSIPSQYDPSLPIAANLAQMQHMQIDGVSSIKDEQLLSATGGELGFGIDTNMNREMNSNFDQASPHVDQHQYGQQAVGNQLQQHLSPPQPY